MYLYITIGVLYSIGIHAHAGALTSEYEQLATGSGRRSKYQQNLIKNNGSRIKRTKSWTCTPYSGGTARRVAASIVLV